MKILIIKHEKQKSSPLGTIPVQLEELKMHLQAGRRFYRDTRPWFLTIGEDAAQSTWLKSLQLNVEWQSVRALKSAEQSGIDMILTEEAVFLQIDQLFWSQPGEDLHLSRWQSFCQLVHKKRSFKAPVGIVICFTMSTVLAAEKCQNLIAALQKALKEATARHFVKIPVYLIITGLEQIEGFKAYAAKLRPEHHQQVFGFCYGSTAINKEDESTYFAALYQQLEYRLMAQLSVESNATQQNNEMLFFPQQLAVVFPKLLESCQALKQASPHPGRINLRGLYFLAEKESRPMFSQPVLTEILMKEAAQFSVWQQIEAWLARGQKQILIGLGTLIIVLMSVWWFGVLHDEAYLEEVHGSLINNKINSGDSMAQLTTLQQLYQLGQVHDDWMIRFMGIFFPAQVSNQIKLEYKTALQNSFEPMLATVLSTNLSTAMQNVKSIKVGDINSLNQDAVIYNALASYLMLNELNFFNPAQVKNSLAETWQNDASGIEQLSLYDDLVKFGLLPQNIDMTLVSSARNILGNQPLEIRAFLAIKASSTLPSVNLLNAASVDGFYTKPASQQYLGADESDIIKKTLAESWVLGTGGPEDIDQASIETTATAVNQFYWVQYFTTWQNTLNAISVKPFPSVAAAADFVGNSTGNDSVLRGFWQNLAQNLAGIPAENLPTDANLNQFANSMNGYLQNSQNLSQLTSLFSQLATLLKANATGEAALQLSGSILMGQVAVLNQLQQLSSQAPAPLQNILNALIKQMVQAVFNAGEVALQQDWNIKVAGKCQNFFQNDNPALDSFAAFFNSNGIGGSFLNSHLQNLISIKNGQISSGSAYGASFILPHALQDKIVKLWLIRQAFFATGNIPSLTINFIPLYLSKNLASFTVSDENQTLFYQNGPRISQSFSWPDASGDVLVKFVSLNGQAVSQSYVGIWGLINFLNSASINAIDVNHYALTFSNGDYSATYEVSLNNSSFAGVLALKNFACN